MCSALALTATTTTVYAEKLKRPVLGGGHGGDSGDKSQTEAEKKLQEDTLGGAIAPRQKDHDIPGYAGSQADRIAGERDADGTGETDEEKPEMSSGFTQTAPGVIVQNNPFAPKHPLDNNKVSFGTPPKITYRPGFGPPLPALTADDMKRLAALAAQHVDINRLTEEQLTEMGLPPETSAAINGTRSPRIDGMLPTEFTVKATIDALMGLVMKQGAGEGRKKAAEAAYNRLSQMADGMRGMKSIPESTYVKMGVGDGYIQERQEGYSNGLGRLKEALDALEAIRKEE